MQHNVAHGVDHQHEAFNVNLFLDQYQNIEKQLHDMEKALNTKVTDLETKVNTVVADTTRLFTNALDDVNAAVRSTHQYHDTTLL